jgi:hypothetical protein
VALGVVEGVAVGAGVAVSGVGVVVGAGVRSGVLVAVTCGWIVTVVCGVRVGSVMLVATTATPVGAGEFWQAVKKAVSSRGKHNRFNMLGLPHKIIV